MHWFNALCWLTLLGTGFALLQNEDLRPAGDWWAALWEGAPLLNFHATLGLIWAGVFCALSIVGIKSETLTFLRDIFRLSPVQDFIWCVRKGLWLVLSEKTMRRLGLKTELPPQGFYNAGQKDVAILAVLCSILLAASGLILLFSRRLEGFEWLSQLSLLAHLVCAGLVGVALPVHIYMAAAAPGERPSLVSMFTGKVPLEHARRHNPLWYAELSENGAAKDGAAYAKSHSDS
jgi:formate dehydrogenase subunit gamma